MWAQEKAKEKAVLAISALADDEMCPANSSENNRVFVRTKMPIPGICDEPGRCGSTSRFVRDWTPDSVYDATFPNSSTSP